MLNANELMFKSSAQNNVQWPQQHHLKLRFGYSEMVSSPQAAQNGLFVIGHVIVMV
jgi:hypothetical protein